MNLLVHFVIYGHSWCFESFQIALAYGSCNFENFQNITRVPINHEMHSRSYDLLYITHDENPRIESAVNNSFV